MPKDFGGVMREFKAGKLHSGSKKGPKVTSTAQAKAIAASEDKKFKHKASPSQKGNLAKGYRTNSKGM